MQIVAIEHWESWQEEGESVHIQDRYNYHRPNHLVSQPEVDFIY